MPLEWTPTTIGQTTVTHWKQHDPEELLHALSTKPIETLGKHPRVRVHKFGRLHVAVREFEPFNRRYNTAEKAFETLRELTKQRAAFVEMPVALIQRKNRNPIVVTIWKKGMRDLAVFLSNKLVPEDLKDKACLTAARKMANLHANGFIHGHLRADNFLVDKNGNSHLVDYTLLDRCRSHQTERYSREMYIATYEIAQCRYPLNEPGYNKSSIMHRIKNYNALMSKMITEYLNKSKECREDKTKRNQLQN